MIATQRNVALSLAAGLVLALQTGASAQTAPKQVDPAAVETFIQATFGKVSPEWLARIQPDETLQACNKFRNDVPADVAEAINKRELARVVFPADGKFLGDWKSGAKIANNGRGGQFSDPPGTVSGGNCYACHQLEEKELSFGTLGPSLTRYGKDRKFDPDDAKAAYTKIFNSQAVAACSNMPRFGANGVLNEQQIKDLVAFLFDPESPVNK